MSVVDASPGQPLVLVLMGVSGCGKSTVAGLLAGRLGWDFEEGDELHPAANVEKMASGHPRDDEDRWPWLANVAEWIVEHTDAGRPGIITCSALKKSYRDVLRGDRAVFVYLAGTREQIARRLAARHGHYMPASLLDSQFDALEPPTPGENSLTVEITASASGEADEIIKRLGLDRALTDHRSLATATRVLAIISSRLSGVSSERDDLGSHSSCGSCCGNCGRAFDERSSCTQAGQAGALRAALATG